MSLTTGYHSDNAGEHSRITGRRVSHARTKANIVEAVRREIPLIFGIIDTFNGRSVEQARAEPEAMDVTRIGTDRARGVGRAAAVTPRGRGGGRCRGAAGGGSSAGPARGRVRKTAARATCE